MPVDLVLCAAAVWANTQQQFFCRPVTWATVVLVVAMVPLLTYNLYRDRITAGKALLFLLFGVAACICVYCILFIGMMNMVLLPFLPLIFWEPVALLAYLPHFLLAQVLYHVYRSRRERTSVTAFSAGVVVCVFASVFAGAWYAREEAVVNAVLRGPAGNKDALSPNYMTERMLGMHFKYHTELCLYDGWRPPLHDPLLVVALWWNDPFLRHASIEDLNRHFVGRGHGWPVPQPSPSKLEERISAYAMVFPNEPIRSGCTCAKAHGSEYLGDPLWERVRSRER